MKFREGKKEERKQKNATHDQNQRKPTKGHKPNKAQTPHRKQQESSP
jgi:hypothetical protein